MTAEKSDLEREFRRRHGAFLLDKQNLENILRI